MNQRLRLFKRGNVFYSEDAETKKQTSLGTKCRDEAQRLIEIRRQTLGDASFARLMLKTCAGAVDPSLATRQWQDVMLQISAGKQGATKARSERAFRNASFNRLHLKKLIDTTAEDFLLVLADGKVSTHHFLRRLHNLAVGLGWLSAPVLPPKLWPKQRYGDKRAITANEQQRILAAEKNVERAIYYRLLWEIGAAQSDAAALRAENIDWTTRTLSFQRQKTGSWSHIVIGKNLEQLLRELPAHGPLFPKISQTNANARSAEFCRRCRTIQITGASLHSYRYALAERMKVVGYPERFAQEALGHNSKAVHRAYARHAQVRVPAMEDYENAMAASPALLAAAA
ncbi:MAG TPA: tyrosine-type recombinase/integrase [Candidatus Limnocylindria bacterium]|jgi:integrase|nr:tyrosine-type recombinase/integrase [Candidatus Limnocylindria bacterium]